MADERVARYLAWWFTRHHKHATQPLFSPDGEAHEVCRENGYLVFETRGATRCSCWWLTAAGDRLCWEHYSPSRAAPAQLSLFGGAVA